MSDNPSDDTELNHLDELPEREGRVLVLRDGGSFEMDGETIDSPERTAFLGGGPDFFVSKILDDSPGPQMQPVARDVAEGMVDGWEVIGYEERPDADEFEPPAWLSEYASTTYRGPTLYPVPEDWVLNIVEGDGICWYRYDAAEYGHDADHKNDIENNDLLWDGPDDEAWLSNEWDPETDLVTQTLEINREQVFEVTEPDSDLLWNAVAEALARYAREGEVDVGILDLVSDEPESEDADLASFAAEVE